jgi:beta-lactamase class C
MLSAVTRRELLSGSLAFALQQGGIEQAIQLLMKNTGSGHIAAAVLYVKQGRDVLQRAFGKAPDPQAVFLLASITKPMTVTGLMVLADRGEVRLSDRVQRFIPEFKGNGREQALVRHLLTHTSGLPDMLPENVELRKKHAPLAVFVSGTCRTPLLFSPGTEVRYQSMGILLASEIVARITKRPFPAFLKEHVFQPLDMQRTSLGLGGRSIAQTMRSQVDEITDWDWNSSYWRNLGAPWGGAHADVADVARFLAYFAHPDSRVVKPETASAMVTLQTAGLKEPWGYGWSLRGSRFGRGCSAITFGHSGSTGTLCWLDPKQDLTFVLLTTKPAEHSGKTVIQPVSDLVSVRT